MYNDPELEALLKEDLWQMQELTLSLGVTQQEI